MKVVVGETPDWYKYKAFCDGKDISSDCYMADEEKGIAYCYERNDKGNVIAVKDKTVGIYP